MGTLFVIGTPIGNLEDITLRALRVLAEVSVVLCEDTRVTRKLLSRYDIHKPLERFDDYANEGKVSRCIERLRSGEHVALLTDAGTPGISDPGARLVAAARAAGIAVVAVPGASALTAALSVAGIQADEFIFLGFPPHKKGRETFFKNIAATDTVIVFYESPHRIRKALASLVAYCGERGIVVCRELTKIYEEVLTGTPQEILSFLESASEKQRGEFVVIVGKS